MKSPLLKSLAFLILVSLPLSTGCAVPQPRGEGLYRRVVEPNTKAVYHLYLPVEYVQNNGRHPLYPRFRKWPLVMTFHGMKPYDNAIPQEREWEKQADIYGYIICAPELETSDSFMEYPLTREHSYVLRDRDHVLAIMDHVFATTLADPANVLSTSWSCGGYLAHYFPNRFPERFSCIATRLSNFSPKLMIEETVPRYREKLPVAIFIGDGDLPACKAESEDAVAWYLARNFRTVRGKMIDSMGHRRIPQTAAAFFAEQIGITPLKPVEAMQTVAAVQMTEYFPPPERIALMTPPATINPTLASSNRPVTAPSSNNPAAAESPRSDTRRTPASYTSTTAGRDYPFDRAITAEPEPRYVSEKPDTRRSTPPPDISRSASPRNDTRTASADPKRSEAPSTRDDKYAPPQTSDRRTDRPSSTPRTAPDKVARNSSADRNANKPSRLERPPVQPAAARARRVGIRVKGPAVGSAPYYLSYSVEVPPSISQGADFLWKDNGVWMGDEPSGVKILETPGVHRITVLMITSDNVEYRGITTVQVLDRNGSSTAGANGAIAAP